MNGRSESDTIKAIASAIASKLCNCGSVQVIHTESEPNLVTLTYPIKDLTKNQSNRFIFDCLWLCTIDVHDGDLNIALPGGRNVNSTHISTSFSIPLADPGSLDALYNFLDRYIYEVNKEISNELQSYMRYAQEDQIELHRHLLTKLANLAFSIQQ